MINKITYLLTKPHSTNLQYCKKTHATQSNKIKAMSKNKNQCINNRKTLYIYCDVDDFVT